MEHEHFSESERTCHRKVGGREIWVKSQTERDGVLSVS